MAEDHRETIARLEARLQALAAQRDSATASAEAIQRDHEQQRRLLTEEQDRFVTRLIEAHEREVGQLRRELEEARSRVEQLALKAERLRRENLEGGEELVRARCDVARLRAELSMARTLLGYAMDGRPREAWETVPPEPRSPPEPRAPRESSIVERKGRPAAKKPAKSSRPTPPSRRVRANDTRSTVPPRRFAANASPGRNDDPPPSSR